MVEINDIKLWMSLIIWIPVLVILVLVVVIFRKYMNSKQRKIRQKQTDGRTSVAFFHPYCNAGGGGERVLWCGIRSLQKRYPDYRYVVYTGDTDVSSETILKNVASRFNIHISETSIEFIFLKQRDWVEAHHYPHFTLLCHSFGSVVLGLEALKNFVPDIFIDTMGYAFTLPVFKTLGQCKVAAYVHYPTISTDMLDLVTSGTESYNNNLLVARSRILTSLKLVYYRLFAWAYAWAGQYSDVVMVNSSWTQNHIHAIWRCPSKTHKVFPPCDVDELLKIPLESSRDKTLLKIVSIAQFRPEKDHLLQLKALAELRKLVDPEKWDSIRLVLVGSCRNIDDKCRVAHLRYMSQQLKIENNVEFLLNVSYEELKIQMEQGTIGIHTMWNEHFGIGIVESMAAGLVMIAHKSGGPMMDIIETLEQSRNGFLASNEAEYAETLLNIIKMSNQERSVIQCRARSSLNRFSDEAFSINFQNSLKTILD